jgi:hypothetical protein
VCVCSLRAQTLKTRQRGQRGTAAWTAFCRAVDKSLKLVCPSEAIKLFHEHSTCFCLPSKRKLVTWAKRTVWSRLLLYVCCNHPHVCEQTARQLTNCGLWVSSGPELNTFNLSFSWNIVMEHNKIKVRGSETLICGWSNRFRRMVHFKIMWRVKERAKKMKRGSFMLKYKRDMLGM